MPSDSYVDILSTMTCPSTQSKQAPSAPLELYGIAVAAVPNEDHLGYDLHCHTIGVSNEETFRVLDRLSFRQRFLLGLDEDDSSLRDVFIRLVKVFTEVDGMQRAALEEYGRAGDIHNEAFVKHGFDTAPVSCTGIRHFIPMGGV